MTLAVFLLIAASWAGAPQASQATTPPSSQSGAETGNPAPEKQDQTPSNLPANTPSETKPQTQPTAPPQQGSTAKPAHHKKKKATVKCEPAAANSTADPASPTTGTTAASTNCPPTKIIVRHGGTSEPSIQLAPSTDQAAKQRNIVNQLLGATDANLKQIASKQLSATQQSTVGQIRDYEQQSRAAVSDGDLERARTLAWKAELLSEDLVKPQK